MTKQEFMNRICQIAKEEEMELYDYIPDEEWEVIEKVYTWHPSISDVIGKQQVAEIYVKYGYAVIKDMYARACVMEVKEKKRNELCAAIKLVEKDMEALRNGEWASKE